MKAYRALIKNFPESPYVPDAWMAFGEYYFDKANKGDRDRQPEEGAGGLPEGGRATRRARSTATPSTSRAGSSSTSATSPAALDLFRAVVFFGELPTSTIPADRKLALVKEARKDYVRTWPHVGSAEAAFEDFRRVGGEAGVRDMLQTLADLYWTDGQGPRRHPGLPPAHPARTRSRPTPPSSSRASSPWPAGWGTRTLAVQQAHVFVKVLEDFEASPRGQGPGQRQGSPPRPAPPPRTPCAPWRCATTTSGRRPTTRRWPASPPASTPTTSRSSATAPRPTRCASTTRELLYALGRFAEAGDEYDRVAALDVAAMEGKASQARGGETGGKAGKWFNDALEGALFAHEEAVKALPPLTAPPPGPKKRIAMAPARQKLVRGLRALRPLAARRQAGLQGRLPGRQAPLRPLRLRRGHRPLHPGGARPPGRPRRRSTPPTWCSTPTTSWATGGTSTAGPSASTPTRRW